MVDFYGFIYVGKYYTIPMEHLGSRSAMWHRHMPPQQRRLVVIGRVRNQVVLDREILRNLVSCEHLYITHHYPNLGCGFNDFFGTFATKIAEGDLFQLEEHSVVPAFGGSHHHV